MNIQRLPIHDDFFTSGSRSPFGGVWVVELDAGEATEPRRHDALEEIYCMVEGEGRLVIADKRRTLRTGEVAYVPRLARHWLENPSPTRLRCLTVEGIAAEALQERTEQAEPSGPCDYGEALQRLEDAIRAMPERMDRVAAIQKIVALFDIAGQLSEIIDRAFGLDNQRGVNALSHIERRVMDAVVEITRRYRHEETDLGLDLGEFGGRLGELG
ncbi:MAG: hypothetical protein KatS3mg102_2465 [Planctomycetota bacterium]|nr:MAG: hypothetical protein KatS3mg102_2465 [Planctomycetota bacterium]